MLILVEPSDCVETRGFGKVAFEPIRPAVIFAAQDASFTGLVFNDRVCTVSANIVEAVYVSFSVLDEKEGEVGVVERHIVARLLETQGVRDQDPLFGDDGSSLKLVQFRRSVPRSWEASGRFRLGVFCP